MKCDTCRKNRPFAIIFLSPCLESKCNSNAFLPLLACIQAQTHTHAYLVSPSPTHTGDTPSLPILHDDTGLISWAKCFCRVINWEFFLDWYVANKQLSSPCSWSRAKAKIRSPLGTVWLNEQSCSLISMANISPQASRNVKSVKKNSLPRQSVAYISFLVTFFLLLSNVK